jgi:hypothetical protein
LLRDKAREDLDERMLDLDEFEWPEAEEGDADPDPLFDSKRAYIDQVDRFKLHQGKPTERSTIVGKPLTQYDLTTVEGRKGAANQRWRQANRGRQLELNRASRARKKAAKAAAKGTPP